MRCLRWWWWCTSSECHVYSIFQQFSSLRYLHRLSAGGSESDDAQQYLAGRITATHVTSPWHHRPNLVHFFQKQCILMLIFKCIFVLLFLMPANMKKLRTNKKYALYAHFPWLYKFFNFQFRARRRTIGNGKLFMMVFVW